MRSSWNCSKHWVISLSVSFCFYLSLWFCPVFLTPVFIILLFCFCYFLISSLCEFVLCSHYFCWGHNERLSVSWINTLGCVTECIVIYDFMLTLTDNPLLSTKVSVTVIVLDVNEFPPELAVPSDTFVCENSRAGQVNWTVSARNHLLIPYEGICYTHLVFKWLPWVTMIHFFFWSESSHVTVIHSLMINSNSSEGVAYNWTIY